MNKNSLTIAFLILLTPTSAFTWTDKVQISGTYAGSPDDHQTPLADRNFAYVFCEDAQKGKKAVEGAIDWRPSTAHSYCKARHKNDPDGFANGWRRSRLTKTCETQLQVVANKVYRCWDYKQDSGLGAFENFVAAESLRRHESWKETYLSKLKIVLEKIDPLIRGIQQNIDGTKGDITTVSNSISRMVDGERDVSTKMVMFRAYHERVMDIVDERLQKLNSMMAGLNRAIEHDHADLKRLEIWTNEATLLTNSANTTLAALRQAEREFAARSDSCTLRICRESRSSRRLDQLRSFHQVTQLLVEEYLEEIDRVKFASEFSDAEKILHHARSEVEVAVKKFDSLFGDDIEIVRSSPPICQIYAHIPVILQAQLAATDVQDDRQQLGALTGTYLERFLAEQKRFAATKGSDLAKTKVKSVLATLSGLIHQGQVSAAKIYISEAVSRAESIVSAAEDSGTYSSDQISSLKSETSALILQIKEYEQKVKSLSQAHFMLDKRVNKLKVKIADLDDLAKSDDALRILWSRGARIRISSLLSLRQEADITRPVFRTVEDLMTWEIKLIEAEELVDAVSNQRGG